MVERRGELAIGTLALDGQQLPSMAGLLAAGDLANHLNPIEVADPETAIAAPAVRRHLARDRS